MKHTKSDTQTSHRVKVEGDNAVKQPVEGVEAEIPATEEQPSESEIDVVKKSLDELQAKYNQLNDTYLRSLAEFDNYRKRSMREKADLIKSGGESVLVNVLTVVDDMERGLAAMKETQDVVAVKKGMDLIYGKLQIFLKQNGVTAIDTEGKDFDTDHHEAITTFPAPTPELKGKVVDCVQKGYILNEKVIRFAKVVVGE
jgi:molecular chaperone GrpE